MADRAVRLGRGGGLVEDIMTGVDCVTRADAAEGVVLLLLHRAAAGRLVAVTDETSGHVIGVVTRADVVAYLARNPGRMPAPAEPEHASRLALASPRVPASILAFLRTAGDIADELGVSLFVVGGFPRDVLLGVPNDDIDLVVSGGEAAVFAARLHASCGDAAVPVVEHEAFHTAVVTLRNGDKIDVATARLE